MNASTCGPPANDRRGIPSGSSFIWLTYSPLLHLRTVACETLPQWQANKIVLRMQAWFQFPLGVLALQYVLAYTRDDVWSQIQGFLFQFALIGSLMWDLLISFSYVQMLKLKEQYGETSSV